ncbi:endonuclease/exonuclease/phosphatase family protein [Microlunatus lacustris]
MAGGPTSRAARPAWDSPEPSRPGQARLVTLATLLTVPGLVLTGMRLLPPDDDGAALVAAFIPFAIPVLALALLGLGAALVRARQRALLSGLVGLVVLMLGAQVAWQLPFFVADGRPVPGATFALLSLNTLQGEADAGQVVAAAQRADVVVLAEVTPAFIATLDARGWRDRFPHAAGASGGPVTNTVVFSRFPLTGSEQFGSNVLNHWTTTVDAPEVGPVTLVAVHPCNPYCGQNQWADQHEDLRRVVRDRLDRPLVVAGDFNAVPDHGPMQRLRRLGLRSAPDLLGTGWALTYPANRRLPPLLAIDHVLVNPALGVTALERVPVEGTDHLGLLTRIGRAG